jgi:hypothetical protein
VSRNTLKKYLKIYARLKLSIDFIEQQSDQEQGHLFGENLLPEPSDRYKTLEPYFPKMEKELKKRGITRHILWERYIAMHPDGYKASQFKYHYQQWRNAWWWNGWRRSAFSGGELAWWPGFEFLP